MEEILKVLNYQPADIRAKLWKLYESWIYFASESPDGEELKDMIFFYDSLREMLNLCYVFTQKNKED